MKNSSNNIQNESEGNSQYTENTKTKVEALRNSLMKFDKDLDDQIDQKELLAFLDSNMKDGRKFDRSLAKKIFEALDLDHNGRITVEEFIKNFLSIEEEIKSHAKELQIKYQSEKENNAKLQKLMMENQNEKINAEGIGNNAKITIEITNIEFLKPIKGLLERISIRIRFSNETKETRILSGADNFVVWKEKFEFRVDRKETLYFEVMNIDDNGNETPVGMVKFPLDKIEKQEEYDLELEIPDEDDEKIINAKINAKIRFIWSTYKFYQDLFSKSERVLQNYNSMLQRTYQLIDNLNEPLKYFGVIEENIEKDQVLSRSYSNDGANVIKQKGGGAFATFTIDHAKQYQVADKVENFLKNTLSKLVIINNLDQPNIQWMGLIKLFIIIIIILAFFNNLGRSDFINIIVPTIIIVIFYTSLNSNLIKNLQLFLLLIVGALTYDLVWFLFSASVKILILIIEIFRRK